MAGKIWSEKFGGKKFGAENLAGKIWSGKFGGKNLEGKKCGRNLEGEIWRGKNGDNCFEYL
jgi:hypothetical protein